MARTFLAFIECVFDDTKTTKWQKKFGFPHEIISSLEDGAEMKLVDIKNDRRYFSFNQHSEVHIVNNVVIFDSDWAEELTIDEDVQFPKTKKMTD